MLKQFKFFSFGGDKWLVFLPIALSIFGLLTVFDVSSISALHDFHDKFHFLKNQSVWLASGVVLFFFFSRFDYRVLKKIAFPFFVINLIFLVLVLIPGLGREVYGGRRWLQLGGFGFQPAELAKLSIIIYLSTLFEKKRDFWSFLTIISLVLGLLILEPDLGTAIIVVGSAFCLYFIAGAPIKKLLLLSVFGLIVGPLLVVLSPYRKQRLLTFLNSSFNVEGASYHVKQVLIALGSGGILGRGFGESRQKFLFLPEVTTDSIFAVIGEEFGLVGSLVLICVLFFLIYRSLCLASVVKDPFGQMLVSGIAFFIGLQTVINLGAMVVLIPLTGVPLPFISYGGSSLLVCLAGMGIVCNISKNNDRHM